MQWCGGAWRVGGADHFLVSEDGVPDLVEVYKSQKPGTPGAEFAEFRSSFSFAENSMNAIVPAQQGHLKKEQPNVISASSSSTSQSPTYGFDFVFVNPKTPRRKKRKRKSPNTIQACRGCRTSKRKCTGAPQCEQCKKRYITCLFG
ncbi:hypothetical protein BC936DRAFT_141622 [Jimgerdemannia flammicorona]|uniref:Zn(2)-C6 fungal-type domain-containing protein n=1 Tax=Jimgerdemannia flammicorona TaxID=994334 RepID=A0A433A1Y0_9FUNG|nr:hypothetical protein BC936DRAFT_141622 [Jimgerdemannia flammicorona]